MPFSLSMLEDCSSATVISADLPKAARGRLYDLGFNPGSSVVRVGRGPFGDPLLFTAKGRLVALRRRDAALVYCVKNQ